MRKVPYSYENVLIPEVYNPQASKEEQEKFNSSIENLKEKIFFLEAQAFAVYVREFFQKNPDVSSLNFYEGHEYNDEGFDHPVGLDVEFVGYVLEDTYYGHYEKEDGGESDENLYSKAQDIIYKFAQDFSSFINENYDNIPVLNADSLENDIKEMLGADNYQKWTSTLEKNQLDHAVSDKKIKTTSQKL